MIEAAQWAVNILLLCCLIKDRYDINKLQEVSRNGTSEDDNKTHH